MDRLQVVILVHLHVLYDSCLGSAEAEVAKTSVAHHSFMCMCFCARYKNVCHNNVHFKLTRINTPEGGNTHTELPVFGQL